MLFELGQEFYSISHHFLARLSEFILQGSFINKIPKSIESSPAESYKDAQSFQIISKNTIEFLRLRINQKYKKKKQKKTKKNKKKKKKKKTKKTNK